MGICKFINGYEDSLINLFNNLPVNNFTTLKLHELIVDSADIDKSIDIKIINTTLLQTITLSRTPYSKNETFNKTITETDYQDLILKFFINTKYEKALFDYYMEVFRLIPNEAKYPHVKLFLLLFAKCDTYQYFNVFADSFYYLNLFYFSNPNCKYIASLSPVGKVINNDVLFGFLKIYVSSLTLLTLQFLYSELTEGSQSDSVSYYTDLWNEENIKGYIKATFYSKEDKLNQDKQIEAFLKEHLDHLLNVQFIINGLSAYSIEVNAKVNQSNEISEDKVKLIYRKE